MAGLTGLCSKIILASTAALRTRFGASEILVTLMLALIAVQILNYLLLGPWKDPRGFNFPQTVMFPDNAMLPILFDGTRTNISLIFALLASVFAYLMMQHHFRGYQLRTAGLAPRIMGFGPAPAIEKLCAREKIAVSDLDVLEVNEAFASQSLASVRALGIADDDPRVNPNGGAIALGHPLGMSGARITGTAALELAKTGGNHAAAAMCIGVGQGISIGLARV